MADVIGVYLCCNNDGGRFAGRLVAVDFIAGGEFLLELAYTGDDDGLPFSWDRPTDPPGARGTIRLPDGSHWTTKVHRFHVGNILWDETEMRLDDALALARRLRTLGFEAESFVVDSPWMEIADAS